MTPRYTCTFPETQLYVSRIVDALLDLLKRGEEDHVDKCGAHDAHSKTCFHISYCSCMFFSGSVYLYMNQAGRT